MIVGLIVKLNYTSFDELLINELIIKNQFLLGQVKLILLMNGIALTKYIAQEMSEYQNLII